MNAIPFSPTDRLIRFLESLKETVHRSEGFDILDPNPKNFWVISQMDFEGSKLPVIYRPDFKFRLATFMPGGVITQITWGQMIILETGSQTTKIVGTVAPDVYRQKCGKGYISWVGIPRDEVRLARIATWGLPAFDPFRMSIDNAVELPNGITEVGIIHSNDAVIGGWDPEGSTPESMMINGADIRAGINFVDTRSPDKIWVKAKELFVSNRTKESMTLATLGLARAKGIITF